jgi:serine/threonine protein kinase
MLNLNQILDGKYKIIRVLGKGGMSTVYLCENIRLGTLWAVKEVPKSLNSTIDLLAEPNILKKLNHPGIPRIIDIFEENSALYLVEDYIEGENLKDYVLNRNPLNRETILDITTQLCSILDYLHSFSPPIIYRDLKPTNIMIRPDGKVILIDFGIARTFKESQLGDTVIIGSQGYIAPEQLMKVQSNIQTDIYSLGAVMYFMACGKTPSSTEELLKEDSYPISLDRNIIHIIQQACNINPEMRFKNISEVSTILNNDPIFEKTTVLKQNVSTDEKRGKVFIKKNNLRKPIPLIILGLIVLVFGTVYFSKLALKNEKKEVRPVPAQTTNPSQKTTVKEEPTVKQIPEVKDIYTKGILHKNNPVILNPTPIKSKGKGKDKDKESDDSFHAIYKLAPAAALENSTLYISLDNIEIIKDNVIAYLSIENKSNTELKLDLNKTYLILNNEDPEKCYSPIQTLTIPANTKYSEVKIYFKEVELEGKSFSLNTFINRAVILTVDVK